MEKINHANKIKRLLRHTWKYSLQESSDILKECQADLQREIDAKVLKEKEREQVIIDRILKRKEIKETRAEERRRRRGYKITRFKKPTLPLKERNQYVRCCKKCNSYYRTFAKYGMVCDKCKTSGVSDGVPHNLNTTKYTIK